MRWDGQEGLQQLRWVGLDDEPLTVVRFEKSFLDHAIEPGQERVEEIYDVQHADRLVVQVELSPGEHFAEFVGGAESSGEGGEGVSEFSHDGLAGMHAVGDAQLGEAAMGQLTIDEGLGNDAENFAAAFEDGVGEDTHKADMPAAKNETDAALCQERTKVDGSVAEGR